jgi:lipoprotein NlpI
MMKKLFLFLLLFYLFVVTSAASSEIEAQKHFDQAVKLLLSKSYEGAIAEFSKAIELNPKFDRAYTNRGIAWMEKGEYDRAIDDYNKATELNPKQFQAHSNRGNAWRFKGDFDRAIDEHTKAIELNPNDARMYSNRGAAWVGKGDYSQATIDFTKAIELNPKYAMAYYNRGNTLYCQGKFKEAIPDYQKAMENHYDPKDYIYLMLLIASQKTSKEEYEKYQKEFTKFMTSHSSYWWIRKIIVFYVQGNVTEQQIISEAQRERDEKKIKERLCEAYYYLGEYKLSKGDKKGAEGYFQKCIATNVFTTAEYQNAKAMLKWIAGGKI